MVHVRNCNVVEFFEILVNSLREILMIPQPRVIMGGEVVVGPKSVALVSLDVLNVLQCIG